MQLDDPHPRRTPVTSSTPVGKVGSRPVPELREKARRGVPFGELGKAEHYRLVDQFDRVRGQYLNRYLIGITRFQLVRWTRDNLAAVYVIPYFLRDPIFRPRRFGPRTPKGDRRSYSHRPGDAHGLLVGLAVILHEHLPELLYGIA
jgi:hypothetical protein